MNKSNKLMTCTVLAVKEMKQLGLFNKKPEHQIVRFLSTIAYNQTSVKDYSNWANTFLTICDEYPIKLPDEIDLHKLYSVTTMMIDNMEVDGNARKFARSDDMAYDVNNIVEMQVRSSRDFSRKNKKAQERKAIELLNRPSVSEYDRAHNVKYRLQQKLAARNPELMAETVSNKINDNVKRNPNTLESLLKKL